MTYAGVRESAPYYNTTATVYAIYTGNQRLAERDAVSTVYHVIHTPCAVAIDLSVVIGFCMFLLPVHMRRCDAVPLRTAAALLLYNRC